MAIIECLPGVEVCTRIDSKLVKEYDNPNEEMNGDDAKKTVVKYIDSVSDKRFTIQLGVLENFANDKSITFELYLDGRQTFRGLRYFNHLDPEDHIPRF